MYKFFKALALIWTILCTIGMLYGCINVAGFIASTPTNSMASGGAMIGMTIGLGFWFLVWGIPTAILITFAWLTKPETPIIIMSPPQPPLSQPYWPQKPQESITPQPVISPDTPRKVLSFLPKNKLEWLIVVIIIVILLGIIKNR